MKNFKWERPNRTAYHLGASHPKISPLLQVMAEKNRENTGGSMKTGLSKKQKTTNVYFNEADSMVEVCTYNTALKNRLTEYAGKYPSECRMIDDDGNGCLTFEVSKGRFGFKLTAPYTEERRKAASDLAKKNTERLRRKEQ